MPRKGSNKYEVEYRKMERIKVSEVCCTDDTVPIAKTEKAMNTHFEIIRKSLQTKNMKLSTKKTLSIVISYTETKHRINIDEEFVVK